MRAKPWDVSDGLWARIEPLLPKKPRRFRYPGRKPFDDRLELQGLLYVLHTGIGWEHLPQELGFGCGMTAWRRLSDWLQARALWRMPERPPSELPPARTIDWRRQDASEGRPTEGFLGPTAASWCASPPPAATTSTKASSLSRAARSRGGG